MDPHAQMIPGSHGAQNCPRSQQHHGRWRSCLGPITRENVRVFPTQSDLKKTPARLRHDPSMTRTPLLPQIKRSPPGCNLLVSLRVSAGKHNLPGGSSGIIISSLLFHGQIQNSSCCDAKNKQKLRPHSGFNCAVQFNFTHSSTAGSDDRTEPLCGQNCSAGRQT